MNYGKDEENTTLDDYFIPANLIPTNPSDIDLPIESIDLDVKQVFRSKKKRK